VAAIASSELPEPDRGVRERQAGALDPSGESIALRSDHSASEC
jgi:hypothetical protein